MSSEKEFYITKESHVRMFLCPMSRPFTIQKVKGNLAASVNRSHQLVIYSFRDISRNLISIYEKTTLSLV
jgi:hypothetical protein